MKERKIGRRFLTAGLMILGIVFFSSEALPWGFATHVYIDDHIGKRHGVRNADEIYGGVAPDIFIYLFGLSYRQDLINATHFKDYMNPWNTAGNGVERSLSFGFVSHNNTWGADFTAHNKCLTCGEPDGYVIAKAKAMLAYAPLPPDLGIPDVAAIEIFHELVEPAVDILIKREDPLIGLKLSSSAMLRSPQFPALMVRAYAGDVAALAGISYPEAAGFIAAAEKEFRKNMILYGQILTLEEETAVQLLSEQTADLAEAFLASYGIQLDIPKKNVVELLVAYTNLAISLCASDYLWEIDE
ncbi:MAG TPA: hypothetical protein VN260_06385, partial [Dissulfurispiraceae bacterium]|nr:hypothetical protein [Dissulfurispiraceae bacterium]